MAGHSKWANIKHKKARMDAKRGKMWSKCSRAIMAAAKNGGPNPDANLTLRYAIDEAKAANMPKDTIENAIKKGSGEAGGQNFESIIYEGYGAGGVAVMIEILTDNRNRTAPEIRKIFENHSGNLGGTGCVAYLFQQKGQVFLSKAGADEEKLMDLALEAGAEDVADQGDYFLVTTEPAEFMAVREAMTKAGLTVDSAELTMIPDNTIQCTGRDAEKVIKLIDALEDHDDVQKVHANYDIPDEELAAFES